MSSSSSIRILKMAAYTLSFSVLLVTVFLLNHPKCSAKRPNIIMIVADDLGWGDVSFHGSSQIRTPDIDALASAGVVLNNYYVSPICTPSRSALLSGRHPINTGLQSYVIQGETPYGLPLEHKILPQYLKDLGYATHAVGKWHIGHYSKKHMPTSRGFDSFFGYLIGSEDYYDHTSLESIGWGMDLRRNLDGVAEQYFGQYSTTMYTKEAFDVIDRHNETSDGPLFLYLCYQAVHMGNKWSRNQVPEEFEKRFMHIESEGRRKMVAINNALNDAVAEVILHLNKHGLLDNSIIIFTSDNGGATGGPNGRVDDAYGSNWPLRGTKFSLWEGGIRAVGLIWSPLLNQSAYTHNGLMHITDWLPTLYAAAGGDTRTLPPSLYGMNLWPELMSGSKSDFVRKEILHNIDDIYNEYGIRSGDYKLKHGTWKEGKYDEWYLPPGEKLVTEMDDESSRIGQLLKSRQDSHKKNPDLPIIVKCGKERSPCDPLKDDICLFNIAKDPCEYNNVASKLPSVVKQLSKMIESYNRTAVKPGNMPPDPRSKPELNGYYWGPWIEL